MNVFIKRRLKSTLVFLLLVTSSSLLADNLGSFNLKTVSGSNITIKVTNRGFSFPDFPGKKVYLNFFGTRCDPCRSEIPMLIEEASYEGSQIISIQAQTPNTSDNEVRSFKHDMSMNYPVVNSSSATDLINFLSSNNRWPGSVPYTLIFDRAGNLLGTK